MVTTIPETFRAFLLPFADHFRRRGFRVDAMAQGVGGCAECSKAFDYVWDVVWSRNPLDHRNLLVACRRVRDLVAQQGYDLVHVHTPVAVQRDFLPDSTVSGEVEWIDSQASFSPRINVTQDDRVQQVYEARVRLEPGAARTIKAGAEANVRILPEGSAGAGG